MKILRCLAFYSCSIKSLHVDSHPFYELIKDTTPFKWNEQHEELFKEIKTTISEDNIWQYFQRSTPFTYTSILLTSEPVAY